MCGAQSDAVMNNQTVEEGLRSELAEAKKLVTSLRAEIKELHKDAEVLRLSREQAISMIESTRAELLGLKDRNGWK